MPGDHPTDPPRKVRAVLRSAGDWARDRGARSEERTWSPALRSTESPELQALVQEREQLREQLFHVRDLSSRLIDRVDEQDQRIGALEADLKNKETLIHDLEVEAADLIAHASNREEHVKGLKTELDELSSTNDDLITQATKREDRISQLEVFLKMIADADDR